MLRIIIANLSAYVCNRQCRFSQKILCTFNPFVDQIFGKSNLCFLLKHHAEICRSQSYIITDFFQGDLLLIMIVDILLRQSYRSHRILFTKCDHLVYFGEHEIKQTGKQCIYSYTIITFVIKFLLKSTLSGTSSRMIKMLPHCLIISRISQP